MSLNSKTDYIGLARAGLEVFGNRLGASNQVLETPDSTGDIIANEVYGSLAAPHVDYKITGSPTFTGQGAIALGKVHGASGSAAADGPYALRAISITTGAGTEPTFGADAVQLKAGDTQAVCVYPLSIPALSAAHHALTFGAFTFTESSTLTLQNATFEADCECAPTTINGVVKAADATKGRAVVKATFWTANDTTEPTITIADGWTKTADFDCTGSDGSMFVWTVTLTKYLAGTHPAAT